MCVASLRMRSIVVQVPATLLLSSETARLHVVAISTVAERYHDVANIFSAFNKKVILGLNLAYAFVYFAVA